MNDNTPNHRDSGTPSKKKTLITCTNDQGIDNWLTNKKKYELIDEDELSFHVIDNTGKPGKYSKSRFTSPTPDPYRFSKPGELKL